MTTGAPGWFAVAIACLAVLGGVSAGASPPALRILPPSVLHANGAANDTAVGNFSSALQRLVTLVGAAGGALLALVWARVGVSWFSNDVTKKVQAKDRARDALVGTLLFVAAISGLIWALARWVITGA